MDSQNKQRITDLSNYEQDLAELQNLAGQAQRPNNQKLLNGEIARLNTIINKLKIEENLKNQVPTRVESQTQETMVADQTMYQKIDRYSFDQSGNKFMIYISLDNVKEIVPAENIILEFKEQSFDLKIKNYKGQNLRLQIAKLHDKIKPKESTLSIKKNLIQLNLIKHDSKHWDQVAYKESPLKQDKMLDKEADPQAGLMNMMKKMYEEGDEEMKRTIAKAWTESQDKKAQKMP